MPHKIEYAERCDASWQVEVTGGCLYVIKCRACGTTVASGGTPKCLLNKCSVSCSTIMMLDDTVIVVDNSNYKAEYAEKVPFKAKVYCKNDKTITVVSLKTDKEYELYYNQVLEAMDIEDVVKLLDLSKYGC